MSVQIETPQLRLSNPALVRIADESLECRARVSATGSSVNIWSKEEQLRPAGAVFVLAHEVFCQIDHVDQTIWFNRTEHCDELWVFTDVFADIEDILAGLSPDDRAGFIDDHSRQCARIFSVPRSRSFDESLIDLVCCYFSIPAALPGGMERLTATGYISNQQFELLFNRALLAAERRDQEAEEWSSRARETETEIIRVARELGLNPRPAGIGPVQWHADCAQSSGHSLMITTGDDQFGCGYCRVSGGVEDLRNFVANSREQESRRQTQSQVTDQT